MPLLVFSQTPKELKNDAQKLFDNQQFVEATPLYSRLLAIEPKNHDYNFKYGTCLLFQSNDKQKALNYLVYAVKSSEIPSEAFYYLGRAYHINYSFKEAIKAYTKFVSLTSNSELKQAAERNLVMCQNGKSKLNRLTEFEVLDKQEVSTDDLYRSYNLSELGGELIVVSDFQSKVDKKKKHLPLVYFGSDATTIYYASYGEDGTTGLDIYKRVKSNAHGWSEPEKLGPSINSSQDENYPFFNEKTQELFFSSNGYESIGGYDVFKSKLRSNDQFEKPKHVDFAISSSEDDILYLSDSLDQVAFFASNRNCEAGKITLYKIKNQRYLQNDQLVKGEFVSATASSISVQVFDQKTSKLVGQFSSNENKGFYFLFPSAGSYLYQCNIANQSTPIPLKVEIPFQSNRLPFVQYLFHEVVAGEDRLSFVNKDTLTDETSADLLATVIRQKADLKTSLLPLSGQKVSDEKAVLQQSGISEENKQIVAQLRTKATQKKQLADSIQLENKKLEQAFDFSIIQKNTELIQSNKVLKAIIVSYNNEKSPEKKEVFLQEVAAIVKVIKTKESEKENLLSLKKKSLSSYLQVEKERVVLEKNPVVANLLVSNSETHASNLTAEEKVVVDQFLNLKFQTPASKLQTDEDSIAKLQQKMQQAMLENANQINNLQASIQGLEQQLTVSQKDKEKIESQLNAERSVLDKYQEDQKNVQKKLAIYQNKLNEIRTERTALSLVASTDVPSNAVSTELIQKSQQQVEAGNSQTLQDFVALTIQKNPLPSPLETLSKQFQTEQTFHADKIKQIQQLAPNVQSASYITENKRYEDKLNQFEEKFAKIDGSKLSEEEKQAIENSLQTIETLKSILVSSEEPNTIKAIVAEVEKDSSLNVAAVNTPRKVQNSTVLKSQLNDLITENTAKKKAINSSVLYTANQKQTLIQQENDTLISKLNYLETTFNKEKSTDSSEALLNGLAEIGILKQQLIAEVQAVETSSNLVATTELLSVSQIQQKVSELKVEFSEKQLKIRSNELLETSEKEQLLDRERTSYQQQLAQLEQTINSDKSDLTSEERSSVLAAILAVKQQFNDENRAEVIDSSIADSIPKEKSTTIEPVITQSSGKTMQQLKAELQEIILQQKSSNNQSLSSVQRIDLQQENDLSLQQFLREKRKEINQEQAEQIDQTEQLSFIDSLSEEVDGRLQSRYQKNEVRLLQIPTEKSLELQHQLIKKIKAPSAVEDILYGDSKMNGQQQLAILNQFTEQLQNEQVEQKNRLQNQPLDLTVQSDYFFLEQIEKRLKEFKETIADEQKLAELEKESPHHETTSHLNEVQSKDVKEQTAKNNTSVSMSQIRAAFQSKESLAFTSTQEPDLLKLKLAEWKRYSNYLEKEKISATESSEKTELLTQEIASAKENILAITQLIALKEQKLVVNKTTLPANSVLKFSNPTDLTNESFIPMDVALPKGLLYRVQIGAFTNPMLAGNHPAIEPISGERMRNGWYRYLSGYFGEYENALKAQAYVRLNGFSDAYLVAYCDGEKISIQQARDLVANGTCIPYNGKPFSEDQNTTIAKNNLDSSDVIAPSGTHLLENETSTKKQSLKRYFEGPDAVLATPIEELKGLMYTVQIGAFLVPVSEKITKGLMPLYTYLLPNKNIRYSVGIFKSIAEANQTKKTAISKGFKDAFIVAYYNGERITTQAAQQLINASNFQEFTHVNEEVEVEPIVEKLPEVKAQLEPIAQQANLEISTEKEEVIAVEKSYQFQTKKSYSIFPRDILNRYNNKGYFYFDASDGKVKSSQFTSKEELPKVFNFKNDLDTLEINSTETASTSVIMLKFASNHLPGSFVNWLQRLSMRVQFTPMEEGVHVSIIGILPTQIEQIEAQLKQLELEFTSDKK